MSNNNLQALTMPKWGLAMTEGKVQEWIHAVGDKVNNGDEILEVETDKISSAVESPYSGVLLKRVAEQGETVSVGGLLGVIGDESVSSEDVDSFTNKFLEEFVPAVSDEDGGQDIYSWAELGDHKIRYLDYGAGEDVVIFIHGFGGDLGNWLFNYQSLGEKKRVIMLDLPGHGESTKDVADGSIDSITTVLKEFVDHLNLSKVDLVGHSMGGALSINMALKFPDLVNRLVLIASAGLGKEIDAEYIKGFADSDSRRELKPHLEKLFVDKSVVNRQFVDDMLKFKRIDGVRDCLQKIYNNLLDDQSNQANVYVEKLANIEQPILVLWGSDDAIIPSKQIENISSLKNISTHVYENAGHMLQLEIYNKVNEDIEKFLS